MLFLRGLCCVSSGFPTCSDKRRKKRERRRLLDVEEIQKERKQVKMRGEY